MPFPARGPVVGFDLDMTLVDSARGIAATLRAALADHGHAVAAAVTDDLVWPLVGIPLEEVLAEIAVRTAVEMDIAVAVRRYRELYPAHGIEPIAALPGAVTAFEAVFAAGGRVLVVSAKAESAVRAVLAHVGLDRIGPHLVAGGRYAAAKGGVLRAHGAHAYVGDHPGDMVAARTGGAVAVGVLTGPHSADQLRTAGAEVVLADLRGFPGWLSDRLPGWQSL